MSPGTSGKTFLDCFGLHRLEVTAAGVPEPLPQYKLKQCFRCLTVVKIKSGCLFTIGMSLRQGRGGDRTYSEAGGFQSVCQAVLQHTDC